MNLMRFLVLAVLGLWATSGYAVQVVFTLEGEPFTAWELAQRDLHGMIASMDVVDADGDGLTSFVAEVVPQGVGFHAPSCVFDVLEFSFGTTVGVESTFPFLQDVDGDSLIVESLGFTSGAFSIGQRVTVSDGTISGLDGLVRENPRITTAADLLAIDVRSLPTFRGATKVVGLMSVRVIPDPFAGDYSDDRVVNAADYVVWRANEGTNNTLSNDPIGGRIGAAQFDQWRAHFGETVGGGSGTYSATNAAVPEPEPFVPAILGFASAVHACRRCRRPS